MIINCSLVSNFICFPLHLKEAKYRLIFRVSGATEDPFKNARTDRKV